MNATKTPDNATLDKFCIDLTKRPKLGRRRAKHILSRINRNKVEFYGGRIYLGNPPYKPFMRLETEYYPVIKSLYMRGMIQSTGKSIFITKKGSAILRYLVSKS